VVQGAAVVTVVLNVICLWKQEPRNPVATRHNRQTPRFTEAFAAYRKEKGTLRLLVAVALGSAAFSMQDVLLEPYGGEVLKLSVSQTTLLTAIWAAGTLLGFAHAGRALLKGANMYRLAALGLVTGITGFSAIIFAEPLHAANLFRAGAGVIGFGGGAVCRLHHACRDGYRRKVRQRHGDRRLGCRPGQRDRHRTCCRRLIRDGGQHTSCGAEPGAALSAPAAGYSVVYHLEIGLLFAALVALGPLAARRSNHTTNRSLASDWQNCPAEQPRSKKERRHGNRSHYRLYRCRPGHALCVLGVLRTAAVLHSAGRPP
jgi:BCD family chlorophyll transporter-like MFS transporter